MPIRNIRSVDQPLTPPHFLRLYAGFAAAYLLSYVYRTVNAVISPDLSAELGILSLIHI